MPQGVMEHSRRKKRANQGNWKLLRKMLSWILKRKMSNKSLNRMIRIIKLLLRIQILLINETLIAMFVGVYKLLKFSYQYWTRSLKLNNNNSRWKLSKGALPMATMGEKKETRLKITNSLSPLWIKIPRSPQLASISKSIERTNQSRPAFKTVRKRALRTSKVQSRKMITLKSLKQYKVTLMYLRCGWKEY